MVWPCFPSENRRKPESRVEHSSNSLTGTDDWADALRAEVAPSYEEIDDVAEVEQLRTRPATA